MLENEKRYIDANMLYNDMLNGMVMTGYQSRTLSIIERQPTADVKEVGHGVWVFTDFYDRHHTPIFECSHYNKEVADYFIEKHNYCLHCGAKMDGEGS